MTIPSAPKKAYAHISSVYTEEPASPAASGGQDVSILTQEWPDKAKIPSVRDIVAFRETLPSDMPPKRVGELAGVRFEWDLQKNNFAAICTRGHSST